ncbi:autotransporter outer membrane beta-barrel domain-containing protein [Pseudomonas sp. CFBP 8770]|uniref:autotransporter outer membrane beta-barrel domain-containing protein n=1 Tax=unclassified Pseudomonas TaxID=196821 RepID=UPI0017859D4D|nr:MULTISPECIES: autotransporter outer membrane beta-barrel domain-containing protein [unclassified Pseudomonas]MBD8476202.1 autotransporter outer membrane beta-barrel domain-containing protein [Pseudomonas sp. CFBP 8773]MBD8648984.1 autotransporter outer membrane beta-barrel domain-containing protein [Pseudomonas sp. CFBP 8770]
MKTIIHGDIKWRPLLSAAVVLSVSGEVMAAVVDGPYSTGRVNSGSPVEEWSVLRGGSLFVTPGGQTLDIGLRIGSTAGLEGATVTARTRFEALRLDASTATVANSVLSASSATGITMVAGAPAVLTLTNSMVTGFGRGIQASTGAVVNISGSQISGTDDGRVEPYLGGVGVSALSSDMSLVQSSATGANHGATLIANGGGSGTPRAATNLALDGSSLQGTRGSAVLVGATLYPLATDGTLSLANGSSLTGGNGLAVEVTQASTLDLRVAASALNGGLSLADASQVTADLGQGSSLTGDVLLGGASTLNMVTREASTLTGNALLTGGSRLDLSLEESSWTGDMSVGEASQAQLDLGNSRLTGNVMVVDTSTATMTLDASTWEGNGQGLLNLNLNRASTFDGQLSQAGDVSLAGGSLWNMTGDSQIASLAMNGSRVALGGSSSAYRTLQTGSLSGSGVFDLNTDLGTVQGDRLVVTGEAAGSHELTIRNSSSGVDPAPGTTLTVVQTGGGPGTFAVLGGQVDAGTYVYDLQKQGQDWLLVQRGVVDPVDPGGPVDPVTPVDPVDPVIPVDPVDPVDPVAPIDPVIPIDPGDGGGPVVTPGARSVIGMFSAAPTVWYGELATLRSRMGELRLGRGISGAWVRTYGGQYNLSAAAGVAYKQRQHGVSFGVDAPLPAGNDQWVVGVMGGYSRSDLDLAAGTSGEVDSYYLGLYSTWLSEGGYYVDGVVKLNRFQNKSDVRVSDGSRTGGNYDNHGVGASLEVGKHIKLANDWYLEPFAQMSALWVQGEHYDLDNGMQARSNGADSWLGKVGTHVGRNFPLANGGLVQPYIKVAAAHEFADANRVRVNANRFTNDLSGTRGEFGAGVIAQISDSLQLHVDFDYSNGENIEQPWGGSLGVRYAW